LPEENDVWKRFDCKSAETEREVAMKEITREEEHIIQNETIEFEGDEIEMLKQLVKYRGNGMYTLNDGKFWADLEFILFGRNLLDPKL